MRNLRTVHQIESNRSCKCSYQNCYTSYTQVKNYIDHYKRKHHEKTSEVPEKKLKMTQLTEESVTTEGIKLWNVDPAADSLNCLVEVYDSTSDTADNTTSDNSVRNDLSDDNDTSDDNNTSHDDDTSSDNDGDDKDVSVPFDVNLSNLANEELDRAAPLVAELYADNSLSRKAVQNLMSKFKTFFGLLDREQSDSRPRSGATWYTFTT